MEDYDPKDLLALCASILDDGEVTSDEAHQLADWLNNHPDASEKWPGNELIKPLQEIWADGSVNRRELHRLARLLISIQREWARHPKTEISSVTDDSIREFLVADINDVRLPSLRGTFRVPSQSEPGTFYEVDLNGPRCTCPDWRTWRSRLPVGDLTRCCKHVLHVYATLVRRGNSDGWLLAFIENGWPAHPEAEWHLLTVDSDKVLFCTASDKGWANVFAKEGKGYSRFGFNVDENRWAYGTEPRGARAIADAIASCKRRRSTHGESVSGRAQPSGISAQPSRVARAVWMGVATIAAIFLFMLARNFMSTSNSQTRSPDIALRGDRKHTLAPVPENTAPSTPRLTPPIVLASPPTGASTSWSANTIRAIRAKDNRRGIVIPKGAQVRVIGRTRTDVRVSYEGSTVTIPISATDLK
jgi:hypothetical protein